MKGFFVLAIASVFTVVVAVSIVYGWGATTSCWVNNGSQHANAMAGSHGLHDGSVSAFARVDIMQNRDDANFGNEFVSVSAHATGDDGDPFLAQSSVNGLDANNNPQNAQSQCP